MHETERSYILDAYAAAWNARLHDSCGRLLARACVPDVAYEDTFTQATGVADLSRYIVAAHAAHPGCHWSQDGEAADLGSHVLLQWFWMRAGRAPRHGWSWLALGPDHRIVRVCAGLAGEREARRDLWLQALGDPAAARRTSP